MQLICQGKQQIRLHIFNSMPHLSLSHLHLICVASWKICYELIDRVAQLAAGLQEVVKEFLALGQQGSTAVETKTTFDMYIKKTLVGALECLGNGLSCISPAQCESILTQCPSCHGAWVLF